MKLGPRQAQRHKETRKLVETGGILALFFLASCGSFEPPPEDATAPIQVELRTVSRQTVPRLHRVSGALVARETAVLTSRVPGYVRTVDVRAGDTIRAGQVLLTLEGKELEARLRAAEAALAEAEAAITEAESGRAAAEAHYELARATHERFRVLREERATTVQEMDEVESRFRSAEAAKRGAEARLTRLESSVARARAELAAAQAFHDYVSLEAPFDGRVIERPVEVGNFATPGTPLLTVERSGGLQVEVSLDESLADEVRPGAPASVILESGDRLEGAVGEIEPAVDALSRSFLAKISLDASPDRPHVSGSFVRVELQTGTVERMLVPETAVVRRGQLELVYTVDGDHARLRLVTLGRNRDGEREVLSGLDEGDRVIVDAEAITTEGVPVFGNVAS